MTVWYSRITP